MNEEAVMMVEAAAFTDFEGDVSVDFEIAVLRHYYEKYWRLFHVLFQKLFR